MQTEKTKIRKFSPLLESSLLSDNGDGDGGVASDEWKAVPDIWKTSADKFGDKIALIDPYHHPPSTITYKQVFYFQFIFTFYLEITIFSVIL
jgi:long-chain acyl-CoA synthetase